MSGLSCFRPSDFLWCQWVETTHCRCRRGVGFHGVVISSTQRISRRESLSRHRFNANAHQELWPLAQGSPQGGLPIPEG